MATGQSGEGPAAASPQLATAELVTLGAAGMWLPLGAITDLITLTGQMPAQPPQLHDPRLRALADHPGIQRLRSLRWPPRARAAFAALLWATQPASRAYVAPDTSTARGQQRALRTALRVSTPTVAVPASIDVASLIAAAHSITPATVTLLEIIGSDAATIDPLLPLRLAHHVPQLPPLTMAGHTMLGTRGLPLDQRLPNANAAAVARTPGTAGITRYGPPTTLLYTQLALPEPLFSLRYTTNELLHRYHPAARTPPVKPLTIVLDTTPPTYGPCEALLRLVAHLLTTTLWRNGHDPTLITLTDPHAGRSLTRAQDLLEIWTSRTLNPPDLVTALATAAATTTHPTVTLTVHPSLGSHPPPSAAHQVVTTHHAIQRQGHNPATPYHHHLGPNPSPAQIIEIIGRVLAQATGV